MPLISVSYGLFNDSYCVHCVWLCALCDRVGYGACPARPCVTGHSCYYLSISIAAAILPSMRIYIGVLKIFTYKT